MKNAKKNATESSFLSIIHTWPDYYKTLDEGIGTTYERFILHHYFNKLHKKFSVNRILEVPSFGMTGISGINSLWWAQNGVDTTVIDTNKHRLQLTQKIWNDLGLSATFQTCETYDNLPLPDNQFDLSWNFASLWFVKDLSAFARELNRLTRKVIFICMPNHYGIGYRLRRRFSHIPESNFYPQHIHPKNIKEAFTGLNWKLYEQGYLDIPPWPDIAMKKEDLFKKTGLNFLLKKNNEPASTENRISIIDYFSGAKPDMETQMNRYAFLEKAPTPVKQLWGHHRYYLFIRQ